MPVILGGNTGIYLASLAPAVDPDAQAFITAASITDTTQQSAINQLVVDLKGYGIWTKMKALYPFVGGDATKHSYNLRNTAQYQITWSGGITHNSNGVTMGGVNGYGNTNFNDSNLTTGNMAYGLYSRTNSNGAGYDYGLYNSSLGVGTYMRLRDISSVFVATVQQAASIGELTTSNTNSTGFYLATKNGSTLIKGYKNTTEIISGFKNNSSATNSNFFLGALSNNGTPAFGYTNRNYAFAFISDGLSAIEASNFYTAVQAFQTTLSRNV